ncbi:MAG: ABC transporter permease [Jatrophihabitans sp.]|uniref:ABC transporter permease n=1 Tax=Jatrophihabitans sp. TaxID=1932789 RepID=UPI003F7D9AAC
MATAALHVVEYNIRAGRRWWRSVLITGVATPLLYVLALGVGLGTVVDRHGGDTLGVPYLQYVAPAFLTAFALQIAAGDATWPIMGGFRWDRTFHGMAVTPLRPREIADGTLLFMGLRLTVNSAVYLLVMACFGATRSWWALLCIPVAALTGVAFAAPVVAFAATVESDSAPFNSVFRFVVTPMFLFSGTFYPISQLPAWGRWLAHVSPLWHGTELARAAALEGASAAGVLGHLAYLALWLGAGIALSRWRFRVRLERGTS